MTNKSEIPTPEVALAYTHLKHIAPHIPKLDPEMMLQSNREQALSRLSSLRRTLNRNAEMKQPFSSFMEKLFENKHAETTHQ